MKDFDEKQKKEYIESGGNACPKCGKCSLTGLGMWEADGTEAWRKWECDDCGEQGTDIYKLTNVERQGI